MKRITNIRSLSVSTEEMNKQINHTGAARTRSQRLNRGLTLLVVGAVALLLAGCADDSAGDSADGGNSVTVPAKPDAPTVTATSDTVLTISWAGVSDETQYRLYRSATEAGTYERIAADESITALTYIDSGLIAGTTYYYRVAACSGNTDASCSAQSAAASGITRALPTPAAPIVTATSDTELAISWSALSGATQYRLYRSATEDGTYERIAADESVIDITYTDSGLTAATTYYYRVAACSGNTDASCSAQSAVASGITRALPAPIVVTASDTALFISWSAVSGATQYRLYRSATEDGTYERIAADESITTVTYTDSGLTTGTTYYYRLAVCNGNTDASCSAQSAAASGIAMIPSVPAAPTVTATSDTKLTISWSEVSGATQYRIFRSATIAGTYTRIAPSTTITTSYTDSGLTVGTTYYYRLAACGGNTNASCSAQSTETSISTRPLPTPVISSVRTSSSFIDSLSISWSPVSGATQYRLYRSATEDGAYERIAAGKSITTATYTDTRLTAGTTYYYRLAACNGNTDASCSAQSVAVSESTRLPIAPALTLMASSSTALLISWRAVRGVTQYRLERSAAETGIYTRIATITSGISYADTGLTPETAYYYRITACGNSADSSCSTNPSLVASATTPVALTTVSGAFASAVYTSGTIGSFNLAGIGQPNITHSLVVISNRLYMMANTTGLSFNAPHLYRLSGGSSAAVLAGAVGPSSGHEFNPQGMATIGNTAYMVGSGKLYSMELDPNTNRLAAFATIVGTLQHGESPSVVENEPRGLAAIGNTLYLVGGSTPALYIVSTTNGSLLKVGDLKEGATFLPSDRLTSAMTANNGTLYTALKSNADIDKAELYSINPTDAQATLIGDITVGGASPEKMPTGLAVWGERLYLLGDGGDNLYR